MKFTLWTLGLLALAAAVYFVRTRIGHHGVRKAKDKTAADRRLSRAEADRRDIQNLVSKLHANNPDAEAEPIPAAGPPDAGPKGPRARLSREASHGHDPDLPVPRSSPKR